MNNPNFNHRPEAVRRENQAARLGKILKLTVLLCEGEGLGMKELAKRLDCHDRTVRRYLKSIASAGIPWYCDSDGKYRVQAGFNLKDFALSTGKEKS